MKFINMYYTYKNGNKYALRLPSGCINPYYSS